MKQLVTRLIDWVGAGASATNTQPRWNDTTKRLEFVPTPGGTLTIQDENGTVATAVTQLDFQGAGVTAAAGTGEVVVTIPGGGGSGGSGSLLAVTSYNPATIASYTTSATSAGDVDATNLAVTFTAPASGKVLVRLTGLGGINGNAGAYAIWHLREGSTVVSPLMQVSSFVTTVNTTFSAALLVTGLVPGSSHTYKWGWHVVVNGTTTARLFAGGVGGPAVMEVHAAP